MSFIGQRSSFNVSTNLKTQELKNSQTQSYLLGHNTLCPYKHTPTLLRRHDMTSLQTSQPNNLTTS